MLNAWMVLSVWCGLACVAGFQEPDASRCCMVLDWKQEFREGGTKGGRLVVHGTLGQTLQPAVGSQRWILLVPGEMVGCSFFC
jgi:hypothetical protein